MAVIREMNWYFSPEETEAERLRRAEEKRILDEQALSFGPHRNRRRLSPHWSKATREHYGQ